MADSARKTIVVVEDSASLRRLIKRIFGEHKVVGYAHADDLFRPEPWAGVDVTIVDLVYRRGTKTGINLLRFLAGHDLGGRRILITGYTDLDTEVLRLLADTIVFKPFDNDEFRRAVLGDDTGERKE